MAALPVQRRATVASSEELGDMAAMLAFRVLEEGLRMLDEGNETLRLRLVTSIAGHPLRRMSTDSSKQFAALQGLLDQILQGSEEGEADDAGEDIDEDRPDDEGDQS